MDHQGDDWGAECQGIRDPSGSNIPCAGHGPEQDDCNRVDRRRLAPASPFDIEEMTKRKGGRSADARTYFSAETPRVINREGADCAVQNRAAHVCADSHEVRPSSSIDRTASRTESCPGRLAQENSPARW